MQLTVNKDLPFRDVAGQIRDRVGDILKRVSAMSGVISEDALHTIVGHSQNRNLSD